MAGLAPLARAKLVACRLLHRSPPRRSSSSPLRAGRCAALHLHRDRAPRRLPHAGARRGLNICAGPVAVSPRVRDGPRDNANAPRLPMSPDPTTGVVSPAPCSGQERSSASGAHRHGSWAVAPPDRRTSLKIGRTPPLRLRKTTVPSCRNHASAPLGLPTAVCQSPATPRLPTPGLEFGRFRFAYAAPRSHQSPEPDTVVAGRRPHPSRLAVSLPTQRLERGTTATSSRACSYSMNSDTSPSTKPAPTCCSRSSARDTSAAPPNHDQSRLPKMAGILQQRRHADLRRPRPASPPCGNHRHRGKSFRMKDANSES